jgi:hypothetical protein
MLLLTVRTPSIDIIYNNGFSSSFKFHRQIKKLSEKP